MKNEYLAFELFEKSEECFQNILKDRTCTRTFFANLLILHLAVNMDFSWRNMSITHQRSTLSCHCNKMDHSFKKTFKNKFDSIGRTVDPQQKISKAFLQCDKICPNFVTLGKLFVRLFSF